MKKIRIKAVMKIVGIVLLVLLVVGIGTVLTARMVNYVLNHIRTENGVDEGTYVTLGGQEQYLLIRDVC